MSLHEAAKAALEALNGMTLSVASFNALDDAAEALRAALAADPALPVAVPGAACGKEGVALIQRGTEDEYVAKRGGERLYRLASPQRQPLTDELNRRFPATEPEPAQPVAWLCELAQEDGSTTSMFTRDDPAGLRFNDMGEPSPYRTTPLYAAPPQRQPLPLEDLERLHFAHAKYQEESMGPSGWIEYARAIERAHGIGEQP